MKIMQERMASFANIFEDEGVGGNDDDDDTREKDTKSIISDNPTSPTPIESMSVAKDTESNTKPIVEDSGYMTTSLKSDGLTQQPPLRQQSLQKGSSIADSITPDPLTTRSASASSSSSSFSQHEPQLQQQPPQRRLLTAELRCIICADDCQTTTTPTITSKVDEKRRPSKYGPQDHHYHTGSTGKPVTDKILAFCGYAQASTILKGGGGVPSSLSSVSDLVGTHVSLCGHVMHTSCLESHLKDRVEGGKRGDFQCPMCRQLSNCLIPLISVGSDWIRKSSDLVGIGSSSENDDHSDVTKDGNHRRCKPSLNSFLSTSKWWAARNDKSVVWNGRCAFLRKGVKPVGKKDLYIAWTIVMKSPRPFLRKRKGSPESSLSSSQENPPPPSYSIGSCSSTSLSLLQHEHNVASHAFTVPPASSNQQISVVTDVWRRVMDQFADVSYKADLKRLGETRLQRNYGEFRHYLVEKVVFNKENRSAGIDIVDVSIFSIYTCVRKNHSFCTETQTNPPSWMACLFSTHFSNNTSGLNVL